MNGLRSEIHGYKILSSGVEPLGSGRYGKVFCCHKVNEQDNQEYCVKIIEKDIRMDQRNQKLMHQEAEVQKILKNLQNCENLVRIYDIFDEQEAIYIIMERCDYDLQKEFKTLQTQNQWYTQDDIVVIMQQTMAGQKCLFEHNIIHRDIKPHNILVKTIKKNTVVEGIQYKIADFGFSKYLENMFQQCDLTKLGSPAYAAPQFFSPDSYASSKCDVFSYGILFYQLVFRGSFPYDISKGVLDKNVQKLQSQPFKCPQIHGKYGSQLQELLEKMIVYSEQDRFSFQQIFTFKLMKISLQDSEDSVFRKLKMDLSQQRLREENNERLREKQLDRLERISKILSVFYRKYLLVTNIQDQIQGREAGSIQIMMIHFIIDQIALNYLISGMGMIFGCISDIHQCFQNDNDIPNLLEMLQGCTNLAPHYENHRVQRQRIIQTYQQKKKTSCQHINRLQVILRNYSSPENSSFLFIINEAIERKFPLKKLVEYLYKLKQYLPSNQSIDRIMSLEEQYPIQRYQKIELNEIFPSDD